MLQLPFALLNHEDTKTQVHKEKSFKFLLYFKRDLKLFVIIEIYKTKVAAS